MNPLPNRTVKFLFIDDSTEQVTFLKKIAQQTFDPKVVELVYQTQPSSGLAYLEACLQMARDLPCLILMDLYLPSREVGWRLLEQIRQLPAPACYLPVLVLSHSQTPDDIEQCYDRGATTYLFKPESVAGWSELLEAVREYWLTIVSLPPRRHI